MPGGVVLIGDKGFASKSSVSCCWPMRSASAARATVFALAAFSTSHDAELLLTYLDRYLPQIDLRYDQPWALGALLHLDTQLGTHHADRLLTPDGLWHRWNARFPGHELDHHHHYHQLITDAGSL